MDLVARVVDLQQRVFKLSEKVCGVQQGRKGYQEKSGSLGGSPPKGKKFAAEEIMSHRKVTVT